MRTKTAPTPVSANLAVSMAPHLIPPLVKKPGSTLPLPAVSIVVPTYNRPQALQQCLQALAAQQWNSGIEILVINDGGNHTAQSICQQFANVRYFYQENKGPAAARNHGIREASHDFILFTDDDCEPIPGWVKALMMPLVNNPDITATKGTYLTRQTGAVPLFVQAEYEHRYEHTRTFTEIDFIDTYSAAYRKQALVEAGGFDESLIAAEDADLSYRLSAAGHKLRFAEDAKVYHQHPKTWRSYLKRKRSFAYWRWLATRKRKQQGESLSGNTGSNDSHTPLTTKLAVLWPAAFVGCLCIALFSPALGVSLAGLSIIALLLVFLPLLRQAAQQGVRPALAAPLLIIARSCWQFLGLVEGVIKERAGR